MRTKFWMAYLLGTTLILFGAYAMTGADPIVLSDVDMQGINGALQYYRCDGEPGCNNSGCYNEGYVWYSSQYNRWECDWTGNQWDFCTQDDNKVVCKGYKHAASGCNGSIEETSYFTGYLNCSSL